MARTRRRKSIKAPTDYGLPDYGLPDYVVRYHGANSWNKYSDEWDTIVDKEADRYNRYCDRIFHRDTNSGYGWNGNVPKSYRKIVTAQCRAKDKAETRKILKKGNYENYSFNPWKSDAGYDYW